jgi:hypothetical protein
MKFSSLLKPLKPLFPARSSTLDCFNQRLMSRFKKSDFTQRQPFPWYNFRSFLKENAFQQLYREFPALDFFETHEGLYRKYGQRSHDRYYLAYEETIYQYIKREHADDLPPKGVIHHHQLPKPWQDFMSALEGDPQYRQFICDLLGTDSFKARYAWHVATAGRSVSPHLDTSEKIGTHIFYFNTRDDWKREWGGSTLVLSDKNYKGMNPEISDFGKVEAVEVLNNRSFLFKNQPEAWHAVDTINCPPNSYRRIFNVIFEAAKPAEVTSEVTSELI